MPNGLNVRLANTLRFNIALGPENYNILLTSQPLPDTERLLAEAAEKGGKYEWIKAAEIYREIADNRSKEIDPGRIPEILELLANSHFKAAFQVDTRDRFQDHMRRSEEQWQRAAVSYEAAGSGALAKRAKAKALFSEFWIANEPGEKKIILEKCIPLVQEAAQLLELQGDKARLGETLLDLVVYREKAVHLSTERRRLVDLFEAAVETAWRIIEDEGLAQNQTILECADVLAQLYSVADYVLEQPRYEELERKLDKFRPRIAVQSEKAGTPIARALSSEILGVLAADLEGEIPKSLGFAEQGLMLAKAAGDNYLIGRLKTQWSAWIRWSGLSEEYVEKRREYLQKAVELASEAIRDLQASSPGYWLKIAYGRLLEASNYITLWVETDIEKKRGQLRKTIDTARSGITFERHSFVSGMGHELSKALYFLATMDVGPEEKARLLSDALKLREETVRTFELLSPHSWTRGVALNYLALIKGELSRIERDEPKKLELLRSAASDMEQCLKLCRTLTGIVPPVAGQIRVQAQYNEWHGDILQRLYEATLDTSISRNAITAFREAIKFLSKSESAGSIPPIRWKIAEIYDLMKEYHDSSESFLQAAQDYRLAGRKIVGLGEVFEDFAQYMEAWAIVEQARLNHEKEQYAASGEAYTKTAALLRVTKNWSHLSRHYTACSFLELGEAMSRQERQQAAIDSMNTARTNFQGSLTELEQELAMSQSPKEKELKDWLQITQGRLKYTNARLELEEAKVLDSRMEEEASSVKYRIASESFRKLVNETRHQPTRVELETLSLLCDACAKMKSAETNASGELFAEAATSFKLVEEKATGKKTRLAALANASMCKALEFGSVFRRTRDRRLYEEIKKNLETAADFYEEAGIKKAADWTRATQRYFDALTYLRDAEIETEPRKRAELFHLAENHMKLAASIYGEAGYAKRRHEALRHLERAREEKLLLLQPIEVLAESPAVSEIIASPVSLLEDKAIGIEKFQNAHIVGSMTVSEKELQAGERFTLDLQILNIGKTTATLGRIENLPTRGLELQSEKEGYSVEDRAINLRGKRLEYLKSYQLKIPFRSRRKGTYELKPRLTFVDEKGNNGSHEFEPINVNVKEIGVLGWLRGPS